MRRKIHTTQDRVFTALHEFRKNALYTALLTPVIPVTYYLTSQLMQSNGLSNSFAIACGVVSTLPVVKMWSHTASSAKNALFNLGTELDIG